MRRNLIPAILWVATLTSLPLASAQANPQFIRDATVTGLLRSYYFSKLYGAQNKPDQEAYSFGGILNLRSGTVDGFRAAVSFFTANALGTHGTDPKTVDTTLMGIAPSINSLGEAYLEYARSDFFQLRMGNQIINTPWLGARDSRMLPQTFQGIYLRSSPVTGLTLTALRIFRWKSRTSDDYHRDNLYYPTNYDDDSLYGIKKVGLGKDTPASNGTLAFGLQFHHSGVSLETWYYDFYQFAHMFYGQAEYSHRVAQNFTPYIAGQYMREWQNNGILENYRASLFGLKGSVNATLMGVKLGAHIASANILLTYDELKPHLHSFGGGAIVSPYGNYNAMYAAFMTDNLLAFGPGHAWRVGLSYAAWAKQLLVQADFSRFDTNFVGKTNGVYLDLIYRPTSLQGLSIRDRVAIDNGLRAYAGHSFIYNRLMFQYAF